MAKYVPIARRRRNAAIVAVAALFVGIVLGWLVGKQSAPSTSEAVRDTQQQAEDIAVQLERLPIEYEQALTGEGDSVEDGVLAPSTSSKPTPRTRSKMHPGSRRRFARTLRTPSQKCAAPRWTPCQVTNSKLPSTTPRLRSDRRLGSRPTVRDFRDPTTEPHAMTTTEARAR